VLNSTRLFWWSAFFLVWTLQVALYAAVTYYRRRVTGDPIPLPEALVASALDWYLWAAICLFCLWLAPRLPLDRNRWPKLVFAIVGWGLVVTVARGILDYAIIALLGWEQIPLRERLVVTFPGRFILFVLFLGVGYAVDYARRHRERELRAAHLRAELATAQLQMLKVQLHPHFLFNTLHAISSLMYSDVAAADRMLVRLAELLRRTLSTMDAQRVTLAEELAFLDLYLDIERTRLGRRLRVETTVASAALDVLVPHLILQPLVENAIRHGIAPAVGGGTLKIGAEIREGKLLLTVADDGVGLKKAKPADSVTAGARREQPVHPDIAGGVGLANTRSRLAHLHGNEASLELAEQPAGGVAVRIVLPVEHSRGSEPTGTADPVSTANPSTASSGSQRPPLPSPGSPDSSLAPSS
jgi:two-component system, LytTR family, sensor kinase